MWGQPPSAVRRPQGDFFAAVLTESLEPLLEVPS